jgi:hypothetical protein
MPAMTNSAPPTLVTLTGTNTTTTIVSGRDTMPLADIRQMLARHFNPNALKLLHRDQRDAAIRAVAQEDCRKIAKPTERAHEICRRLALYAGGTYRFERDRPPEDPAKARLHRVLALQEGSVPSFSTVWRALAGAISPNAVSQK